MPTMTSVAVAVLAIASGLNGGGGTPATPLRAASSTNFIPQGAQTEPVNVATAVDVYDRLGYVLGSDLPSITIGFSSAYIAHGAGITLPGNGYTIQAVTLEIGAAHFPILFGGIRTAAVTNGQNLLADPITAATFSLANFLQGTQVYIRYRCTLTTPATDKWTYSNTGPVFAGEAGFIVDPTKVNFTNGVDSTGVFAYSMINGGINGTDAKSLGQHLRPIILGPHTNPATGMWGDSKTYGTGDIASAGGGLGMNRLLLPNPASIAGARSGINFGNPSGVADDCTRVVGGATTAMLSYWYQFLNYAVVGYGTNGFNTAAQTALYAQIRAAGIVPIIQRSLTPRTTSTISGVTLVGGGTTVVATVPASVLTNLGISGGGTFVGVIAGATPAGYNTVAAGVTMTVTSPTTVSYVNATTGVATGTITIGDLWESAGNQILVASWGVGQGADTFEQFLRGLLAGDANLSYYQSQGERVSGTVGTANYWIWIANGTALFATADGLHESAGGYEMNIGTAGTLTTQAGGTVVTSLRAVVQAFV